MPQAQLHLGVILVSRPPASRWARRGFVPSAVLAAVPEAQPGTRLGPAGETELWYAGARALRLYSGETGHYRDNLASARPAVWVALRQPAQGMEIAALTVDPYEGEALAGDEGLLVEAVAMPAPTAAFLADFVATHHVEQVFVKRKRKRADPEALARRGPLSQGGAARRGWR